MKEVVRDDVVVCREEISPRTILSAIKSDCDKCIYADGVSGYEDGQDMFVCGIESSLTDEDVECANKNECPYYIPNDDE